MNNIEQSCQRIVSIFKDVIPLLGYDKKHTPKVETDGAGDETIVLLDGGIAILPMLVERKARGFLKNAPKATGIFDIHYQIQALHHDPGVYRYRDGSGQPPSDEFVDVGEPHLSPYSAVQASLSIWQEDILKNLIEGLGMAEQIREDKELFEKATLS